MVLKWQRSNSQHLVSVVSCSIGFGGPCPEFMKCVFQFTLVGIGKPTMGLSTHWGWWESEAGELCVRPAVAFVWSREFACPFECPVTGLWWWGSSRGWQASSSSTIAHNCVPASTAWHGWYVAPCSKTSLIYSFLAFRGYHALLWVQLPLSVVSFFFPLLHLGKP